MAARLSRRILGNIDDDFAILVIAPSSRMEEANSLVLREIMRKHESCVYVTVNQPYNRMAHIMKKRGIDIGKIFFIDCITETGGGKAERAGNCLYLSSPSNLTELSIAISQVLHSMPGKKFLFLDSLSTLLIYNAPGSLAKFTHFLMTRVKLLGLNGVFMVVEKEIDEKLLSEIVHFSDRVIRL